jgi:tetratricopeptide (TPR) repeat protein
MALARRVADLGDAELAAQLWTDAGDAIGRMAGGRVLRRTPVPWPDHGTTTSAEEALVMCLLGRAEARAGGRETDRAARSLGAARSRMATHGAPAHQRRAADALDAWISGVAGDFWPAAVALERLADEAAEEGASADSIEWSARAAWLRAMLGDGRGTGALRRAVAFYEGRGLGVRAVLWSCQLARAAAAQRDVEESVAVLRQAELLADSAPAHLVAVELAGAWGFVELAHRLSGDTVAAGAARARLVAHAGDDLAWAANPAAGTAIHLMLSATYYPSATGEERAVLAFGWGAWLPDVRSVEDDLVLLASLDLDELERVLGSPDSALVTAQSRGQLAASQLDLAAAVGHLRRAVAAVQRIDRGRLAEPLHDLGVALRLSGDVSAAAEALGRAVASDRAHPDRAFDSGGTVHELAAALGLLGRSDEALVSYRVARDLHAARGQEGGVRDCDHNIAALRAGAPQATDGCFRSGLFDQVWLPASP